MVVAWADGRPRPERYLSRGEAAEHLGVKPRTIQQWAQDGRIPFIRTFGGHRRFSEKDLDALVEMVNKHHARRVTAPPDAN